MTSVVTAPHPERPGQPIVTTPFCVLDVETTGGSAEQGAITEIGAVRIRGGDCEGTWSTLVDPGQPIPRWITELTGIRADMVADAPPFAGVVDQLLDFIGDAVVVGHNVRYDLGFLAAEFARAGRHPLQGPSVCTLALARRLVRDEVPNCSLGTLADRLGLSHPPTHRALDDAIATAELFHVLLERAGHLQVTELADLFELPRLAGHPQAAKLRLTDDLPHAPGVYVFRDRAGTVLYVGKATDLRSRVRSYFSTDDRRKVAALLRSVASIDHEVCVHPLAAAVREVHLIARHLPRFNSQATRWRSMAYLRLTDESFPRFSVVRNPPEDASVHLGPLVSSGAAHRVIEAVTSVVPLRRCNARVKAPPGDQGVLPGMEDPAGGGRRRTPCAPAQLGVACCPCSGDTSPDAYAELVATIERGLTGRPDDLLDPLRARLDALVASERFEDAARVRDRAAALAAALQRQRRLEAWRAPRRVVATLPDGSGAEILHGMLGRVWGPGGEPGPPASPPDAPTGPIPKAEVYERLCIITEMERARSRWRIEEVDGTLVHPAYRIDDFLPRGEPSRRRGH